MSEDEEKCRLTYKEGREIARKVEKAKDESVETIPWEDPEESTYEQGE